MLKYAEQDPWTKIEAMKNAVTQVSECTLLLLHLSHIYAL
jgi:hypothetical protein